MFVVDSFDILFEYIRTDCKRIDIRVDISVQTDFVTTQKKQIPPTFVSL